MAVKMLFFAQCAEWMGCRELSLKLDKPTPVADLLWSREELSPILERQGMLRVGVNEVIATFDTEVKDGDEIAVMPPVSGG